MTFYGERNDILPTGKRHFNFINGREEQKALVSAGKSLHLQTNKFIIIFL